VRKRLVVTALALVAVAALLGAVAYAVLGPQPEQQARRDGCAPNATGEATRSAPSWVYVDDGDYPASGAPPPARWLAGVLDSPAGDSLDAHVSGGDFPPTHDAYDFNLNVKPDAAYEELLGGNPEEKTGNFEEESESVGRIHIERELTALPRFVWPQPGARVKAMGSWVWDCGHWDPGGERTELHPYRALWTERRPSPRSPDGDSEGDLYLSTDATPAGQIAECAHRAKGDRQAFRSCTFSQPSWLDVGGDYDLFVRAPARPSGATKLVARVVDMGSTVRVQQPKLEANGARLRFRLEATPGKRLVLAEEVFVGWRPARKPVHLRVTFTRLLTRRSMDPACARCPNPQSRRKEQITRPPGEWLVFVDVEGIWRLFPHVVPARDGRSFQLGLTQDLYVQSGRPFRLLVAPHECDFGKLTWTNPAAAMAPCPRTSEFGDGGGDDTPGVVLTRFRSPEAALGVHAANGSTAPPSTCPAAPNPHGCYQITYRIRRVP
jgi:hypothetical protein